MEQKPGLCGFDDRNGRLGFAGRLDPLVNGVLQLWALMYVIAPFMEEPWLVQKYGKQYLVYKSRVPRFIGRARSTF